MAYSVDDKCKKLAKNAEAAAIISEYSPGFATDPQMKMVMGLTLRKLASFPRVGLSSSRICMAFSRGWTSF